MLGPILALRKFGPSLLRNTLALPDPRVRYRHAQALHAIRVGLAMLTSILVTVGLHIPHGAWASVTLIIVIGGLQHHGNIRSKAFERASGTLIGATVGLLCIGVQRATGLPWLTYALMSIFAAVFAYHAVGKGGYIALLSGVTMCIVAAPGETDITVGLWRSATVLIGIGIALVFSFTLPLYATYTWRNRLAENLRLCAHMVALTGGRANPEVCKQTFASLNEGLVKLRALMSSVQKEIDVPQSWIESLQREHRVLVGALDLYMDLQEVHFGTSDPKPCANSLGAGDYLESETRYLRDLLLALSRAVRFGDTTRLIAMQHPERVTSEPHAQSDDLMGQIVIRVERIRSMLLEQQTRWNMS